MCRMTSQQIDLSKYKVFNVERMKSMQLYPGLGADLRKKNARPKCTMKRPYSTHLSYEKILAGL